MKTTITISIVFIALFALQILKDRKDYFKYHYKNN